ncbi:MAG: OB-fold nucleic acid binding domain-containing protein, partial [Patescibacteria group bacterium]
CFGNRANLLIAFPEIVSSIHKCKKQNDAGQTSLFTDSEDPLSAKAISRDVSDFSSNEKLAFEKEFLGLYLTSHPQLSNLMFLKSIISHEIELLEGEKEGTKVKIGGIIESARRIFTKRNNNEMAFLVIGNEKGLSIECVVFPRIFQQHKSLLVRDSVIVIEGYLDTKNDKPTIIAERISAINRKYE